MQTFRMTILVNDGEASGDETLAQIKEIYERDVFNLDFDIHILVEKIEELQSSRKMEFPVKPEIESGS